RLPIAIFQAFILLACSIGLLFIQLESLSPKMMLAKNVERCFFVHCVGSVGFRMAKVGFSSFRLTSNTTALCFVENCIYVTIDSLRRKPPAAFP
ncbi:hypothetical protein HDV63DRAFT_382271, partial [Trichoderma sp. SZMC 28014]